MPTDLAPWALSESLAPVAGAAPSVQGLSLTLARGSADFQTAALDELVRTSIRQILGIRADDGRAYGELPWRGDFGSLLHRLLYLNQDEAYEALVHERVVSAIERWEPRCRVKKVSIQQTDTTSTITVLYDLISPNTGTVVRTNQRVDVPASG